MTQTHIKWSCNPTYAAAATFSFMSNCWLPCSGGKNVSGHATSPQWCSPRECVAHSGWLPLMHVEQVCVCMCEEEYNVMVGGSVCAFEGEKDTEGEKQIKELSVCVGVCVCVLSTS